MAEWFDDIPVPVKNEKTEKGKKWFNAIPRPKKTGVDKHVHKTVFDTSTPDEEAKISDISNRTKLPIPVVRYGLKSAESYDEFVLIQDLTKDAPKTSEFLSDPKNLAATRDDVENLAEIEKTSALGRFKDITLDQFGAGVGDLIKGNEAAYMGYRPDVPDDVKNFQRAIRGMNDAPTYWMQVNQYLEEGKSQKQAESEALVYLQEEIAKKYWGEIAKEDRFTLSPENMKSYGLLGDAWFGLVRSSPAMAAQMLGGVAGMGAVYQQISGAKYDELLQAGATEYNAAMGARATALFSAPAEFAGNVFQIRALMKGLKGKKAVEFIVGLAQSMSGEGLEEYIQQFADEWGNLVAANPESNGQELFDEFMSRFAEIATSEESKYAAKVGAVGGAILPIGGRIIRTPVDLADYAIKKKQTQQFNGQQKELDKAISTTLTAERNPVMMEKFLNEHMGLDKQDAYVESEAILELNQTAPEVLEELVTQLGEGKTVEDVVNIADNGQDIRLNLGAFHSRISPETKSKIFDHLKASPGSYSVSKVEEGLAQTQENFEEHYRDFATENELIDIEMRRLEKEAITEGIEIDKAGLTTQTTARMAISLSSGEMSAADILRKIHYGPVQTQEQSTVNKIPLKDIQVKLQEADAYTGEINETELSAEQAFVSNNERQSAYSKMLECITG